MKTNFKVYTLCFCFTFFFSCSSLWAQTQEKQMRHLKKPVLQSIETTFGFGVVDINIDEMNTRLQALGIDQFYDNLAVVYFSIYTGFHNHFGLSADISGGSSLGGKEEFSSDARVNLNSFSFGPTFYYSFITTNRIRLMALGGLRMNTLTFKYNSNAFTAPDFDVLLTNPSAISNNVVVMKTAFPAESATLGARFQYRLGKKENLKPREYSLGIDTGYNYSFETVPWSEPLSKQVIRNMPAVKTDHFYANVTFSALLLR